MRYCGSLAATARRIECCSDRPSCPAAPGRPGAAPRAPAPARALRGELRAHGRRGSLFLLRLEAGGHSRMGRMRGREAPLYSYETVGTARHVIRDHLAPAILGKEIKDLADLASRLGAFRGHPMAKAGIELAFVDLVARLRGEPIARAHRRRARQGRGRGEPGHPAHRGRPGRAGAALPRPRLPPHQAQDQAGRRRRRWSREIRRRHPEICPLRRRQRGLHPGRRRTPAPARRLRSPDDRAASCPRRSRGPRPPAADPGHRDLSRREHHQPRPGPPGSRDRRLPHRQHEGRTRGRLQRGAAHP